MWRLIEAKTAPKGSYEACYGPTEAHEAMGRVGAYRALGAGWPGCLAGLAGLAAWLPGWLAAWLPGWPGCLTGLAA